MREFLFLIKEDMLKSLINEENSARPIGGSNKENEQLV